LQSFVDMEQENQKLRTQIAEIETKLNTVSY